MKSENWKKILKDIKSLGVSDAEITFSDGGGIKVNFVKELPKKVYSAPIEPIKQSNGFNDEDLFHSA